MYGWPKQNSSPYCDKCGNGATWVDHGPMVGKGWYCKHCKDDIKHPDNVFGLSASQTIQTKEFVKTKLESIFPSRTTGIPLNCTRNSCTVCVTSSRSTYPKVDVYAGDIVIVNNNGKLNNVISVGQRYKVVTVNLMRHSIYIKVLINNASVEYREYSRCRFSKV